MANKKLYEILRQRAKEMGHKASRFPDAVWEKYLDVHDEYSTLREAKLYLQGYMMGELNGQEFAQILAEDDKLRYTVADICKQRLEPAEPDIQRNGRAIDIGAGIKTFWTEMKVPLPSEVKAARDIQNINIGVEAGRASAAGQPSNDSKADADDKQRSIRDAISDAREGNRPKKRSIREVLADTRQRWAQKAIDTLAPYAQGKDAKDREAIWMQTKKGKAYRDDYTYKAANDINNVANNVQAGKNPADPKMPSSGYSADELNGVMGNDEYMEIIKQVVSHMHRDLQEQGNSERHKDSHEDSMDTRDDKKAAGSMGQEQGNGDTTDNGQDFADAVEGMEESHGQDGPDDIPEQYEEYLDDGFDDGIELTDDMLDFMRGGDQMGMGM